MYAENYAHYRAPPGGGEAPPTTMTGGGGPHPSAMMQPAQAGRPRGIPGGGGPAMRGGGDGGVYDPTMVMAMDHAARRMPRGPMGSRGGREEGGNQWNPSTEFAPSGLDGAGYGGAYPPAMQSMAAPRPMGRQPQQGDSYLPPSKYRRTSDFDGFEDPRSSGGRRPAGPGGDRGENNGPRGPPSSDHRAPANNYDLSARQATVKGSSRGGAGPSAVYTMPSQQQQQQQLRPPSQRAGYAQYAPPSPHTPRTQQEIILMRRRLMDQERDRFASVGYRNPPPSSSGGPTSSGGAPPPTMSSAAAAWARELDPYDNARRIHRELQPPSVNGGGPGGTDGGSSMTPQRMQRSAPGNLDQPSAPGYANSPGSRIVTPAAALHSSHRPGGAARRNPSGPSPQATPGSQMTQFDYNDLEPMPLGVAAAPSSMTRARVPSRALPPAVTGQLSMQEYEAMMMMERELGAVPMHQDPRRGGGSNLGGGSRPSSVGSQGRGSARTPPRSMASLPPQAPSMGSEPVKFDSSPYMMEQQQGNEYTMAPAAVVTPVPTILVAAPPKPARQSKAAAAREAREAAAAAQTQAQAPSSAASKKRKEPAASKRKARPPAEESTTTSTLGAKTKDSSKASGSKPAGNNGAGAPEPKRRCGRKSMNYSSEQKRERNRAAVKKCRQRQALKYEYLKRKAEVLASENRALSEMLVKNVELDDEKRNSLTRGIQMDILLKIKEIFTQSLPKDFVLDADSIWDLNSVLAVSMPSRCYYGIESIKDFWRTSLRMRNKGKIRSFWAWLFRLPPGDRFAEFTITPFSPTSNLYFINWTTKSTPALSGSIVIMFGHGHRVTLHVEIFGWLIWRYLLTNTPFPEPLE